MDLQGANTLLANQHQIDDLEPNPQRHIGILEDRPNQDGEPIALVRAVPAKPMEWPSLQFPNLFVPTARALHSTRPAASRQISLTGFVIREQFVELIRSHLLSEPNGAHRSAPRV